MKHRTHLQLFAAFVSRGLGAFGSILLSIILARLTGASSVGQIAVFIGAIGVLSTLGRAGLDILLMRAVAYAIADGARPRAPRYFLHSACLIVVCLAAVIAAAGIARWAGWISYDPPGGVAVFVLGLLMFSIAQIVASYLKGSDRSWYAPLFENGGISLLLSLALLAGLARGMPPSVTLAAQLFLLCAALVAVVGVAGIIVEAARGGPDPVKLTAQERGVLTRGGWKFLADALAVMLAQSASFLLVAPILSDETIGLIRAAERLAIIVSFPILCVNPFIVTRIAVAAKDPDREKLRRLVRWAMLVGLAVSAAPAVLLVALPGTWLGLLGPEFVQAGGFLIAMVLTHFAILLLGPYVVLAPMLGAETELMILSIVTLAVSVVLFPTLAALMGAWGFVAAYCIVNIGRILVVRSIAVRRMQSDHAVGGNP